MTGSRATKTLKPDAERVQRLLRKIDSWETLLNGGDYSQHDRDKATEQRLLRLDRLRQRLEIIKLRQKAPTILDRSHHLSLPPLELCHREEKLLCEQYLDAHLKVSDQLHEQLVKVKKWLDEASVASKNSWKMKFRLNKIRSFLGDLEQERHKLEPHRHKQTQNWERLLAKLLLFRDPQSIEPETQQAFERMVRLTDDIASLSQKIQTLHQKTQKMEHWLKEAQHHQEHTKPPIPPLAEDLRLVTQKSDKLGLEDLHRTKSRLSLARKYLETYLERVGEIRQREAKR